MNFFDWDTNTVTFRSTTVEIDMGNPAHVMLAEAARGHDDETERMQTAALALAKAATDIAENPDSTMTGLGHEQQHNDMMRAMAKREAHARTMSIAFSLAKGGK